MLAHSSWQPLMKYAKGTDLGRKKLGYNYLTKPLALDQYIYNARNDRITIPELTKLETTDSMV